VVVNPRISHVYTLNHCSLFPYKTTNPVHLFSVVKSWLCLSKVDDYVSRPYLSQNILSGANGERQSPLHATPKHANSALARFQGEVL